MLHKVHHKLKLRGTEQQTQVTLVSVVFIQFPMFLEVLQELLFVKEKLHAVVAPSRLLVRIHLAKKQMSGNVFSSKQCDAFLRSNNKTSHFKTRH